MFSPSASLSAGTMARMPSSVIAPSETFRRRTVFLSSTIKHISLVLVGQDRRVGHEHRRYGLPIVSRTRTREPGTNMPSAFGTVPYSLNRAGAGIDAIVAEPQLALVRESGLAVEGECELRLPVFHVRQQIGEASARARRCSSHSAASTARRR